MHSLALQVERRVGGLVACHKVDRAMIYAQRPFHIGVVHPGCNPFYFLVTDAVGIRARDSNVVWVVVDICLGVLVKSKHGWARVML